MEKQKEFLTTVRTIMLNIDKFPHLNMCIDIRQAIADEALWYMNIAEKYYPLEERANNTPSEEKKVSTRNELETILKKYFSKGNAMSKTALRDVIKQSEQIGSMKAYNMIEDAIKCGILEPINVGGKYKYRLVKLFTLEDAPEAPF